VAHDPNLVAHTPPDEEPDKWQSMHEHTNNVAQLAAAFAKPFGAEELALWCGWLHDVGKYSDEFQNYLRACDAAKRTGKRPPPAGSAEHKCAGTLLARELWPRVPWLEPIVTLAVLGHHGGLNSPNERDAKIIEAKKRPDVKTAIERARADLAPELASARPAAGADVPAIAKRLAPPASQEPPERGRKSLEVEMLARFVFSCLVDADTLDTEAHFNPDVAARRKATPHALADMVDDWQKKLASSQNGLQSGAKDTPVNRVRRAVYEDCLRAAERPPGVFTLTVPTGGGKTRSSLAFALKHGLLHGRSRIIYAAPYTTILDQTAGEFRKILGVVGVIEHHSAVEARIEKEGRQRGGGAGAENQAEDAPEQQRRLATQNWDAPLIVTTTVQLFESLFASRTKRCRKLHNVADSVIILDEVQTLPPHLLAPLLSGLRTLVEHFGVTLVLCTATQPAITGARGAPYLSLLPAPSPIITEEQAASHFKTLRRVDYDVQAQSVTWAQLAEAVSARKTSCLVVLNTKKDALAVLDALKGASTNLRHLSTMLCLAHRIVILDEVKAALEAERSGDGPPVLLVSTQVIEAGCDIDFPRVFRAKASLDRVIQAAGRCNREGERRDANGNLVLGEVVVFNPAEGGLPRGTYRAATDETWPLIIAPGFDFHAPQAVTDYFAAFYQVLGREGLDQEKVQAARADWDFPGVSEKVRLIADDTVPVLVPWHKGKFPDDAEMEEDDFAELVEAIRERADAGKSPTREQWQKVQPLCVAVFRTEATTRANIDELIENELYLFSGTYDRTVGIGRSVDKDIADLIISPGA